MSEEPRRSGRSTKGQHNKLDSPGPADSKKRTKKSKKIETQSEDEDDEQEVIRCICGNDNPDDKRPFIGCDECKVWQHNVCMGMPDDDEEVGEHYFCEQCKAEQHGETLEALERGEKIWETRNKLYANEKKKSKSRKSKGGNEHPPWLKRELREASGDTTGSNKRKRVKEETEDAEDAPKPARGRLEKRRKAELDPDTALVPLDKLPADRQKVARALTTLIADDVEERVAAGSYDLKDNTSEALGEHHGTRIEYALHINHGGPAGAGYIQQFRTLNANLKKNKTLIQELLASHLTADELSTMSSSDMASEELQKERAAMKAESDRQAVIDQRDDGPRYRRTHKGDEIVVENEGATTSSAPISRPVRQSEAEVEASPVETKSPVQAPETFDVKDIWAKTGPAEPRPLARRKSTLQEPVEVTKEDAEVDRLLADDDEYAPTDYPAGIVWRGKIVQTIGDPEPTVNARWVAGRDVSQTISWRELLPVKLNIDGRLQISKAEEYLCGLQWSKTSDVSVLALTPYDDAIAFNNVFNYFKTRQRYAVVNKDKPAQLIKDLYIIPVDAGDKLPEHIEMLEHCTIKKPVEEKLLLATFVVSRAPIESPQKESLPEIMNQHHVRAQSIPGPAGSPINPSGPQFTSFNGSSQTASYEGSPQSYPPVYQPSLQPSQEVMQMAVSILGDLVYCDSARRILVQPGMTRDIINNMKKIFDEHHETRTDFAAFVSRLPPAPV